MRKNSPVAQAATKDFVFYVNKANKIKFEPERHAHNNLKEFLKTSKNGQEIAALLHHNIPELKLLAKAYKVFLKQELSERKAEVTKAVESGDNHFRKPSSLELRSATIDLVRNGEAIPRIELYQFYNAFLNNPNISTQDLIEDLKMLLLHQFQLGRSIVEMSENSPTYFSSTIVLEILKRISNSEQKLLAKIQNDADFSQVFGDHVQAFINQKSQELVIYADNCTLYFLIDQYAEYERQKKCAATYKPDARDKGLLLKLIQESIEADLTTMKTCIIQRLALDKKDAKDRLITRDKLESRINRCGLKDIITPEMLALFSRMVDKKEPKSSQPEVVSLRYSSDESSSTSGGEDTPTPRKKKTFGKS